MTRTPRPSRRTRLASAAVLAPLALGLAACGGDDDADDRAEQPAATVTVTEGASDTPADDTTDDTTDDGSTDAAGGSADLETAAQTALGAVSGATLFSLDRDAQGFDATLVTDDGVEQDVEIAADGTTITRGPTEDVDNDNDADDAAERERLLDASLDYAAAIEAASAQAQGTVTGVDLGEDNGTAVWEVQFDEDTPTETTVDVDAESGEVLRIEQDD